MKTKVRIDRDNGQWFITKINERGVIIEARPYQTRADARAALKRIKGVHIAESIHKEMNSVQ